MRDELQRASESLRRAAEVTDDEDLEGRIYDQSRELATLATADEGPDHGRLARHVHTFRDLAADADDPDAERAIEEAVDAVQRYREGVEGV
ncbi:MAG: hypothetical protein ABEJ08_01315 [Halobacteriaceae archaeon]